MNVLNVKLVFSFLFIVQLFFAQQQEFKVPDSLQQKTYEELMDAMYSSIPENLDAAKIYAASYLKKAKNENNPLKIAEGFNYLAYVNNGQITLNYLDSIIDYTKGLNLKNYPAYAYLYKGDQHYKNRDFKKALDNYLEAGFYANKHKNRELTIEINFNIGLIKTRLGYYEEALSLFKSCADYYLKQGNRYIYLANVYAIADTYRHLHLLDSASFYNEKGLNISSEQRSLGHEDYEKLYNYFVLNEGVNQYEKKNYQKALDAILSVISYIENIPDKPNSAMGYHFLGKIYMQFNKKEKAAFYLKKVDTIFLQTSDIHPELRNGYEILINTYRLEDNMKQQLLYIKRLLKIDSILKSNYEYLSKKLVKEYDTPKLIRERDTIIRQLKNRNTSRSYWIISLAIMLGLLSVILYYYYKKQKAISRKFEQYMGAQAMQKPKDQKNDTLPISQEIQKAVLKGLEKFEFNKGYLDNRISLNSLAKKLNTNANYLSKMVNFYKGKSFGNYISELRINHTVEKLKTDKMFRRYSVKAIAKEAGFNNSESFARFFRKKTGLYPSQFIRQLKKVY